MARRSSTGKTSCSRGRSGAGGAREGEGRPGGAPVRGQAVLDCLNACYEAYRARLGGAKDVTSDALVTDPASTFRSTAGFRSPRNTSITRPCGLPSWPCPDEAPHG